MFVFRNSRKRQLGGPRERDVRETQRRISVKKVTRRKCLGIASTGPHFVLPDLQKRRVLQWDEALTTESGRCNNDGKCHYQLRIPKICGFLFVAFDVSKWSATYESDTWVRARSPQMKQWVRQCVGDLSCCVVVPYRSSHNQARASWPTSFWSQ